MLIEGLRKLTLLDYPGRVACTVFTYGCNFRCPFCHNASLVTGEYEQTVSEEEIDGFLKKRRGILDGVCITGGEPLLQPDIDVFIRKVRSLGYLVKLDTNGSRPEMLKKLVGEGIVDYVAMDIKSSPVGYGRATGVEDIDLAPIRESVDFLLSGAVDYEFRTTAVDPIHTPDDFAEIGKWIKGAKHYFIQQFVDSGDLVADGSRAFSADMMKELLSRVLPYVPSAELRGV